MLFVWFIDYGIRSVFPHFGTREKAVLPTHCIRHRFRFCPDRSLWILFLLGLAYLMPCPAILFFLLKRLVYLIRLNITGRLPVSFDAS